MCPIIHKIIRKKQLESLISKDTLMVNFVDFFLDVEKKLSEAQQKLDQEQVGFSNIYRTHTNKWYTS